MSKAKWEKDIQTDVVMWQELLTIFLPVITGIAGWCAARRKKNNDFLHELQATINMLVNENAKLLEEQVTIKNRTHN
ncbi:MAG: hypothetical protein LIO93_08430 [Bacteroidales bacterium]|nr:hypothetical protein [Bacteroidales bacterium]